MRRVVVAHDAGGGSIIASDAEVTGIDLPGIGVLTTLWAADAPATYPDDGADPAADGIYPPVGGVRVIVSRYAAGQKLGAAEGGSADVPWEDDGMHRTDTTDFMLVLDGEMVLTVDGGVERILKRGDITVMAGARHAWRNDGAAEAVVAFFLVGAHRAGNAAGA